MLSSTADVVMEIDSTTSNGNSNNNNHTGISSSRSSSGKLDGKIPIKMAAAAAMMAQQQHNGAAVVIRAEAESTTADEQQQPAIMDEVQELMERIKPSSYGQKRNYSTIDISAEKWLMAYDQASLAKLESPPSLADGISKEMEKEVRYLGCELIQSGAILLKLNQTAAATGQILFQRFYYQKSFVRYHFEHMVMACLLLASKIEEEPRKPRDVLNAYHRLKQLHQHQRRQQNTIGPPQLRPKKFDYLELGGRQYVHMKNMVIKAERRLLNTLGFVVHVHHPHKLIYIYLHILGLLKKEGDLISASQEDIRLSRQLLQRAWSYMNDGLRTDMFLRYKPETIACACIQLAAKTVDKPIVLPKEPFPWFELFDASDRDVRLISQMLLDLYARRKAPNLDWLLDHLERQQQKLANAERSKADRELADMKEAIIQRKSEAAATAAALHTSSIDKARTKSSSSSKGGDRGSDERSRQQIEKASSTTMERHSTGGGGGNSHISSGSKKRSAPPPVAHLSRSAVELPLLRSSSPKRERKEREEKQQRRRAGGSRERERGADRDRASVAKEQQRGDRERSRRRDHERR